MLYYLVSQSKRYFHNFSDYILSQIYFKFHGTKYNSLFLCSTI